MRARLERNVARSALVKLDLSSRPDGAAVRNGHSNTLTANQREWLRVALEFTRPRPWWRFW